MVKQLHRDNIKIFKIIIIIMVAIWLGFRSCRLITYSDHQRLYTLI